MRIKHAARMGAVAGAAVISVGFIASPAQAGQSTGYSKSKSDYQHCTVGAQGRFLHQTDAFSIRKICGLDKRNGVLLADLEGDSAPEKAWWTDKPAGSTGGSNYNVPEGTRIAVRACIGDRSEGSYWLCGPWMWGTA